MIDIVKKRLWENDCETRGWMLVGYPHTREAVSALFNAKVIPNKVILLSTSSNEIDPVITSQYTEHIRKNRVCQICVPEQSCVQQSLFEDNLVNLVDNAIII
jgi:adenylate kinase family enzyme